MEIKEIFDNGAVSKVVETLNSKCVDGRRLTRAELCHELGLTEALPENTTKDKKSHNLAVEAVIGSLINLGIVEGFATKKGPGGGIGRIGDDSNGDKKVKNAQQKRVEYPAGFLDNLRDVLNTLCVGDTRVGRKAIVKAMTLSEEIDVTDAMNLLSSAKRDGHLPGYDSARGVGGGFYRVLASTETLAPVVTVGEPVSPVETASNDEPVIEVAEASATEVQQPSEPEAAEAPKGKNKNKSKKAGKRK